MNRPRVPPSRGRNSLTGREAPPRRGDTPPRQGGTPPRRGGRVQTAGEAVVEALLAEGVEVVFGLPGRHVFGIYDALRGTSIRHINAFHEHNATLMADMYGRLTGRPGVCLLTGGPGAVNSLSGIAQAYEATSPVVHLSGTVPRNAPKEVFHGADRPDFLRRMFRDVTKWSTSVERAADLPRILSRAFWTSLKERPGPVHVEIPFDVMRSAPEEMESYRVRPLRRRPPPSSFVRAAASALRRARRPVLLAGKGVLTSRATGELSALAASLKAPVIVTRDALGALPTDDPWSGGYLCFWSTDPWVLEILRRADLVLAAGLRAESAFWRRGVESTECRRVFLGTDDGNPSVSGAEVHSTADVKLGLSLLREALAEKGPGASAWDPDCLSRGKKIIRDFLLDLCETKKGQAHQGAVVRTLLEVAGPEAILVSDVCAASYWLWKLTPIRHPFSLVHSGVWSGMGFALAGALVSKFCHPNRPVVGVIGDGAFLMVMNDLPTAVREGIPMVLVVMNDGQYGLIHQFQVVEYGVPYAAEIGHHDFACMAEAMGGLGFRADSPEGFKEALRQALSSNRPAVVDVQVSHEPPYPSLDTLQDSLKKLIPA